jgi:hypothetical protein
VLAGGAGASGEVPAPADLGGGLPRRLGLRFAWEGEIGCFASAKSGFRPNAIKFLGFARLPAPTIALPLKCPEVRIHC